MRNFITTVSICVTALAAYLLGMILFTLLIGLGAFILHMNMQMGTLYFTIFMSIAFALTVTVLFGTVISTTILKALRNE